MTLLLTFFLNLPAQAMIDPFLGSWSATSGKPGIYIHEVLETSTISNGLCKSVTMKLIKVSEEKLDLIVKYTCGNNTGGLELLGLKAHGTSLFYGDNSIGVDRGKSLFIKYQGIEFSLSVARQPHPYLGIYQQTEKNLFELKVQLGPSN
ncbi:MAG: hypothetical protein JNM93_13450 [Bacteriovoracaceae bacterium]|nr:hypothetical protein [Bacteriovoracaceae bacterium]